MEHQNDYEKLRIVYLWRCVGIWLTQFVYMCWYMANTVCVHVLVYG